MQHPLVTIAMPAYNEEKYIEACIASALPLEASALADIMPRVDLLVNSTSVGTPAGAQINLGGVAGCPHEEGKDYPRGGDCPFCPFWASEKGKAARERVFGASAPAEEKRLLGFAWYREEDYEHMLEGLRKAGWTA